MLSVGWQYLQSCSLVVCVLAGYAGYHGYALPEARVRWGDCRGSLLAVGRPPEVPGLQGSLSRLYGGSGGLPGRPQGETSLRVWVKNFTYT